jgi:hypothetical protein
LLQRGNRNAPHHDAVLPISTSAAAAQYLHARVWLWDGKEAKAHPWHLMVRREK